jgi:catechol 2,3-dioxygenase-like lactoylglutathione lyase family enzyme
MSLELRRVILFTSNVAALADFYQNVIGLTVAGREEGWVDFNAGACGLALHAGRPKAGTRPPKIVFHSSDVARTRSLLVQRGLTQAGPVKSAGRFDLCDCRDPDGNPFQISSRA